MKKIIALIALLIFSVGLVSASEPNIQFRGVSHEDINGNTIPQANDIGDKIIVDAYIIDDDGYEDLKDMWLYYEGHSTDCVITSTRDSLVNLICTATVEANMETNTPIYLKVKEQDNSVTTTEIPYSPFNFQKQQQDPEQVQQWGYGFKIKESQKYGEFEFPEVKDYYYSKIGISVGGVMGTNDIKRSSLSLKVKTKEKERITATAKRKDKPSIYTLSDDLVIVEQRVYIRHTYYTKYNKTYSSGRVKERSKRNYDKGYTTIIYEIHPQDRNVLITFNFNGKDFKLSMEGIQFMKQVYQNGVSGRKVWVKY